MPEPEIKADEQTTEALSIDQQIEALVSGEEPEEENAEQDQQAPDDNAQELEEPESEKSEESDPEKGETENIDYDQAVPMPDGREAMSVGALKDRVIELERTEEQNMDRENDIMRRSDQLSQALQMAGGEIPPELSQQMNALQDAHLNREHEAMLNAIPEWKDPEVFKEARKELVKLGTNYGLTHKEISGIMDHRLLKFMHDHVRLLKAQETGKQTLQRLKAVPAKKGQQKPSAGKTAKLKQQVSEAASSRDQGKKLAAIDALLAG